MGAEQAGTIEIAGRTVARLGFGSMRLTGPRIWGPPADVGEAIAVLRRAIDLGVRVIDTAWYYGDDVANGLIAQALRPYPEDLVIVTKLGATRTEKGDWLPGVRAEQLRAGNDRDRRVLGLDTISLTHLRWGDGEEVDGVSFPDALDTMLEMQAAGRIGRIGVSNVSLAQLDYALSVTDVGSVSNLYSLTDRSGQPVLDRCAAQNIPFLPFFPLAVGKVGASQAVAAAASETAATTGHAVSGTQVALAWLLAASPVVVPIPGTSSVAHLEDNVLAAALNLSAETLQTLDAAAT